MKEMMTFYFHGTKFPELEYEHKQIFEFSKDLRNEIVDKVMDAGYNVLLQRVGNLLVIHIDKYRFQQR